MVEEMEMRGEKDIEIGEDVTPPLLPLAYSLHNSFLHSHCSSCFSPLPPSPFPPFLPATATTTTTATLLYCSSICSSSDSHYHFSSAEFHLLRSLPSSDSNLRAALRLLHSLPPPSSSATSPSHRDGRMSCLLTNREKLMTDDEILTRVREGAEAMAAAKRIRDGKELIQTDGDDDVAAKFLLEDEMALCLVLTNAVEVQDNFGRNIGIAVYDSTFSWINHSCSPNVCYRFLIFSPHTQPYMGESRSRLVPAVRYGATGEYSNIQLAKGGGPRLIIRSIKRIKEGEEVTVAYTDLLQPKEIRQSELWANYRFLCCCPRCCASPPTYVDHILQEISASSLPSSSLISESEIPRDEAARMLIDCVDEVIAEYLSVCDPECCCKRLENILLFGLFHESLETEEEFNRLNFKLHPLHHCALNTYTTLASAYKIRASDLLAFPCPVSEPHLEAFNMSRTSAAYSLLLATATYYLFCFEASLIASVANFWTSAGESLITLARSSAWDFFGKQGLLVSNFSSPGNHKCRHCTLLDRFEAISSVNGGPNADLENMSNEFHGCIARFSQKAWSFLIQDCDYLKRFRSPFDFEAHVVSNNVDSDSRTEKSIAKFEGLGCTGEARMVTFHLGVHCLLYGGLLASICYGENSLRIGQIRSILGGERT